MRSARQFLHAEYLSQRLVFALESTSGSVSGGAGAGESGIEADVSMQETDENARQSDSFDLYYDEGETQFGPTQGSRGSTGSRVSWSLLRCIPKEVSPCLSFFVPDFQTSVRRLTVGRFALFHAILNGAIHNIEDFLLYTACVTSERQVN